VDLDKLIETLRAGGASQAEIDQVVESYTAAKYRPKAVALTPAFYLASDAQVMLGATPHTLRLMNMDDLRRLLPKVIEFTRFLIAEQGSDRTPEQLLAQTHPMGMVGVVVHKLLEINLKGEYPEWFVALLEELAVLVSTESRSLSAADLISLPPSQLTELIQKLVEVNQRDFLALWASVPPGIRSTISTLASRLTSAGKALSTSLSRLENSSGGAGSTGKPTSSSPSAAARAATSRRKVLAG